MTSLRVIRMRLLCGAVGLVAGNFVFQWMQAHPDWHTAAERSWWNLIGIGSATLVVWLHELGEQ